MPFNPHWGMRAVDNEARYRQQRGWGQGPFKDDAVCEETYFFSMLCVRFSIYPMLCVERFIFTMLCIRLFFFQVGNPPYLTTTIPRDLTSKSPAQHVLVSLFFQPFSSSKLIFSARNCRVQNKMKKNQHLFRMNVEAYIHCLKEVLYNFSFCIGPFILFCNPVGFGKRPCAGQESSTRSSNPTPTIRWSPRPPKGPHIPGGRLSVFTISDFRLGVHREFLPLCIYMKRFWIYSKIWVKLSKPLFWILILILNPQLEISCCTYGAVSFCSVYLVLIVDGGKVGNIEVRLDRMFDFDTDFSHQVWEQEKVYKYCTQSPSHSGPKRSGSNLINTFNSMVSQYSTINSKSTDLRTCVSSGTATRALLWNYSQWILRVLSSTSLYGRTMSRAVRPRKVPTLENVEHRNVVRYVFFYFRVVKSWFCIRLF